MSGPTSDILKTKSLSMSDPCPGNLFCCSNFQLLAPCNLVILTMTPKRRIVLKVVTALRMLGEVSCLYRSKISCISSSSKIFCGSHSLARKSGPNTSFAVSNTIVEPVADGVYSTWTNQAVCQIDEVPMITGLDGMVVRSQVHKVHTSPCHVRCCSNIVDLGRADSNTSGMNVTRFANNG